MHTNCGTYCERIRSPRTWSKRMDDRGTPSNSHPRAHEVYSTGGRDIVPNLAAQSTMILQSDLPAKSSQIGTP